MRQKHGKGCFFKKKKKSKFFAPVSAFPNYPTVLNYARACPLPSESPHTIVLIAAKCLQGCMVCVVCASHKFAEDSFLFMAGTLQGLCSVNFLISFNHLSSALTYAEDSSLGVSRPVLTTGHDNAKSSKLWVKFPGPLRQT